MDSKQTPSKKKLLSIREEKLKLGYDSVAENSAVLPKKQLLLDLEILRRNPTQRQASQRVLVSVKPRAPAIKTLYIAEKSRFHSKKGSEQSSRSRLGIGDHSSFTTRFSGDDFNIVTYIACGTEQQQTVSGSDSEQVSALSNKAQSEAVRECFQVDRPPQRTNVRSEQHRSAEKCYVYTQPQLTMNLPRVEANAEKSKAGPNKVDIATLVVTNTSSEDTSAFNVNTLSKLQERIDHLERKVFRQEMVFRSIDPNLHFSSSDDECQDSKMRSASGSARPGCSYIQQYSHIPETSAFQRYAQKASSLSPNKATNLEKEHNSEQYGRDFTAYDGITARGRRQCASVPCKRDDFPKMAAERVHKIRHKLNPVRDYRLMDTVHYLAQGEFAPRDDGIKLTPSREGVLSDIIWEDVCRTHWPTARLGRRNAQPERCSTRCELQRLIDSLLRERVAHVERRRRRHYRIVKLNHRHESCRPVGKTGDIIVASHKNKESNEERELHMSDHNAASALILDRRLDKSQRRSHRSHDRLIYPETRPRHRFRQEDCSPGPSYAASRAPDSREPTCCYRASSPVKDERDTGATPKATNRKTHPQLDTTSDSSTISKPHVKRPRLVVKRETSRMKYSKEELNLEQYILLPTLVIRSPSNVRRQKKFNELYHRILNVEMHNAESCAVESEAAERNPIQTPDKKDIGFNINITLSSSTENIKKKKKPK